MEKGDRKAFSNLMIATAAILPKRGMRDFIVNDEILQVYWKILEEYDIEEVRKAFFKHLKDVEFGHSFPTPAEIISKIQGSPSDNAVLAWIKLRDALRKHDSNVVIVFDDNLIHYAIYHMDGWKAAKKWGENEMPFKRNEFISIYKAACKLDTVDYPYLLNCSTSNIEEIKSIDFDSKYAEITKEILRNKELMRSMDKSSFEEVSDLHANISRLESQLFKLNEMKEELRRIDNTVMVGDHDKCKEVMNNCAKSTEVLKVVNEKCFI